MYYYSILTEINQPKFAEAAQKHSTSLNNYLTYGIDSESPGFGFDKDGKETTPKLKKPKEVRHQSTVQVVNNMTIYTTTILCCEDDQD